MDKFVHDALEQQEVATIGAVIWVDGGRSGGHDITEWCMVLVDDSTSVFNCTVSE